MPIIPFYGASDREMFALERAAMDRAGRVLAVLDEVLPDGRVIDIGAGDGFTATRLAGPRRTIVALEPALGMIPSGGGLPWVAGEAEALPFADECFDAAYATWAYFFPAVHEVAGGLAEARRVVRAGRPLVIVDNAGDDEFSAMAPVDIAAPLDVWREAGFAIRIVETSFVFESIADARRLLEFFFGDRARPALEVEFRVAVMVG